MKESKHSAEGSTSRLAVGQLSLVAISQEIGATTSGEALAESDCSQRTRRRQSSDPRTDHLYFLLGSSMVAGLFDGRWTRVVCEGSKGINQAIQVLTGSVPYCATKRLNTEPIDAQTPEVADRYVAFMCRCWSMEPEKRPSMETAVNFIEEEINKLEE
ncbi:hypothetical protein L210DRAFT_2265242 [Boletus edulis BED1]|uniref:Uncharacterized protein n=1 Tax=Boletus edulis BED1 TaxID=1328754 RepID=A0AAD4BSC8_BOLED|nr:hypothetical protein L210DRAFT_2265242 [Boletus edulis BED1]